MEDEQTLTSSEWIIAHKTDQAGLAVEILAQNDRTASGSQDLPGLPALLGLDTLSLSLPTSVRLARDKLAKAKARTDTATNTAPISRIKIQGIPADHVHLLFSSPGLDTGIRSGFWIQVPSTASNINLRFRWNRDTEELEPCLEDQPSENESESSIKTFDYGELLRVKSGASAGASPVQDEWTSLTRFITPVELNRLVPSHSTDANGIQTWPVSTLSTSPTDSDLEASPAQQADIHFTPITLKNTFPPSSIGRDRTKHSLDKSWYLTSIIPSIASSPPSTIYGSTLLAEFALSFLLASTLGSSSASQHWKDILRVSLRCTSAVTSSETYTYFVALLELLEAQLQDLALFPSETQSLHEQPSEQNQSTVPTANQTPSAPFESEDDLAALYELLFSFGQKNLANPTTTAIPNQESTSELDSPRAAVRTAYLSLATATTTSPSTSNAVIPASSSAGWDLATALSLASADDEDDKQHRRLQRRILRGMEGFGYGSGSGLGYGDVEHAGLVDGVVGGDDDDDRDDDEDAPIVLDLEGLLGSPQENEFAGVDQVADGETGEYKDEQRDEDEDDGELEDLRY